MSTDAAWGHFAPEGMLRLLLNTTLRLPSNWLGKRLFYALRRFGRMKLAETPVDVVRFGAKLRLNANRNVCEGRILFNPRYFDSRERSFLEDRLPEQPVFIDIGANIGGYSFYVCHVRPDAQVIAIEAQRSTFQKLLFNAHQNPHMRIHPLHCALSNENGMARLFVNSMNNGESSIRTPQNSVHVEEVPSATLMKVVQDLKLTRIDALKLDIEGAEDIVLEAFFKSAPESLFPRLILIEHSPQRWDSDVIGFLRSLGYGEVRNFGGNIALERREHLAVAQEIASECPARPRVAAE